MTPTKNEPVAYWSDWLVDAVAGATQNRMFLRGDPECDPIACEAIHLNGAKAIANATRALQAQMLDALERMDTAFIKRHGCYPLDRTTDDERFWCDAMDATRAILKQFGVK